MLRADGCSLRDDDHGTRCSSQQLRAEGRANQVPPVHARPRSDDEERRPNVGDGLGKVGDGQPVRRNVPQIKLYSVERGFDDTADRAMHGQDGLRVRTRVREHVNRGEAPLELACQARGDGRSGSGGAGGVVRHGNAIAGRRRRTGRYDHHRTVSLLNQRVACAGVKGVGKTRPRRGADDDEVARKRPSGCQQPRGWVFALRDAHIRSRAEGAGDVVGDSVEFARGHLGLNARDL
jgi:hypothetical protein